MFSFDYFQGRIILLASIDSSLGLLKLEEDPHSSLVKEFAISLLQAM
jgi:hypothetical protein